jgi:lipopolysaccharide transport system permease protein
MDLMTDKSVIALESTPLAQKKTAPDAVVVVATAEPGNQAQNFLPDQPLVTIDPRHSQAASDPRELWKYRELLYFLIMRDLKLRYKQTVFGVGWVVLQPLLLTLVFTVFLGILVRIPSEGVPYALFAYAGLWPWTFFSGAVLNTSNSLVGNTQLITKVYFPRIIIPCAAIGGRVVDFGVSFVVLAAMMLIYRVPLTRNILMLPVLVILLLLLALGIGMWTSALNVKYRDVAAILPVLIQLFMYVSPVLYPLSLVPANWRWLFMLNPMSGIINGFRAALLGQNFDWMALGSSAAIMLVLLVSAAHVFRRMEKSFADIV